jgi:hypothetical protein
VITEFCRNKGHGFIKPSDESEPIFVHISEYIQHKKYNFSGNFQFISLLFSSIEGEWCPKAGDVVSFKKTLMPPKCQK